MQILLRLGTSRWSGNEGRSRLTFFAFNVASTKYATRFYVPQEEAYYPLVILGQTARSQTPVPSGQRAKCRRHRWYPLRYRLHLCSKCNWTSSSGEYTWGNTHDLTKVETPHLSVLPSDHRRTKAISFPAQQLGSASRQVRQYVKPWFLSHH